MRKPLPFWIAFFVFLALLNERKKKELLLFFCTALSFGVWRYKTGVLFFHNNFCSND